MPNGGWSWPVYHGGLLSCGILRQGQVASGGCVGVSIIALPELAEVVKGAYSPDEVSDVDPGVG